MIILMLALGLYLFSTLSFTTESSWQQQPRGNVHLPAQLAKVISPQWNFFLDTLLLKQQEWRFHSLTTSCGVQAYFLWFYLTSVWDCCLTTRSVEILSVKVSPCDILLVNSYIRNSIFKAFFGILCFSSCVLFVFLFKLRLCGCVTLSLCVFAGLMSRVQAIRDHRGKDCRFLSFRKGDTIFVYHKLTGKRDDLWAGSVRLISHTSLSFSLSLSLSVGN